MEVFSDWKFWMSILHLVVLIAGFCIIKFNDLRHLEKDVGDIKKDVRGNTKKLNKIDKGLAVQKQRIDNLEKSTT
jgi:hypothetical protein